MWVWGVVWEVEVGDGWWVMVWVVIGGVAWWWVVMGGERVGERVLAVVGSARWV